MPNVQWKTPDDGQSNCPKRVEFLDKNKFGKLVLLLVLLKRNLTIESEFYRESDLPDNCLNIFLNYVVNSSFHVSSQNIIYSHLRLCNSF